ncbi:zinc-finger double domain-containing protein [Ditylenchus destructor]|nr:zinc-finger double domain-containing protein [Ditylenchus destructor]
MEIYNYLNKSTIGAASAGIRCPLCPISLDSDESPLLFGSSLTKLEKHMAEVHYQDKAMIHKCECAARFNTHYSLLQHFREQHTGISNEKRDEITKKIGIYEALDDSIKASFDAILAKPNRDRGTKVESTDDSRTTMVESSSGVTNSGSSLAGNRNSESAPLEVKTEQISSNVVQVQIDVIEIGDDDEQTVVKQEPVQTFRNAVKSEIEIIEIDDDDEQTEVKQEPGQTSQDAALEAARSELGQIHNVPAIAEIPEAIPDPPHSSPMEEQEVASNIDFGHLASANPHPDVISSAAMDIGSEINTTDNFHGASEEVHDSDVARASVTTGQESDNSSTQLPRPNEVHIVVDPNASNDITDTATSVTISTKIPPLKKAKSAIKQKGSRKSKHPIAPQETARGEETPLKLRLRSRKHIHHGDLEDHELVVGTKRSRLSRTERNLQHIPEDNSLATDFEDQDLLSETEQSRAWKDLRRAKLERLVFGKDNSLATSTVDGQTLQEHGFGESTDESEKDDDESEFGLESESDSETDFEDQDLLAETEQSRISRTEQMRTHAGDKRFKCETCEYATNWRSTLSIHERIHSGEKPYKCRICNYASAYRPHLSRHIRCHTGAQRWHLIRHFRSHTGEKPYKCRLCKHVAARGSNLNQHMRTHHNDAFKLRAANNKKNPERKLKKSGMED